MAITGSSAVRRRLGAEPWAALAAAGVVVYVALDVLLAFLRPDLSLIHNAESDYGVGSYSWVMDLNFLLRGALTLSLVLAISRRWRPSPRARAGLALLAAWGVGSALLAFFPDNPPGTAVTASGGVHLLLAALAFLCALAGTIMLSVDLDYLRPLAPLRGWLLGVAVLAVVPLLALGRAGFRPSSPGGLVERCFLALELLWILIAALHLARAPDPSGTPGTAAAA